MSDSSGELLKKTGKAAGWQVLGGAWVTIVRLVSSFFLARLLTPGDFGLYGMAVIVVELINCLGNVGMNAGVVAKKEVTDQDLCTCFWSMAGVRTVLFLIAFLGAPFASSAFNEPRLTGLLRVVSLHFLISIASVMSQTILVKRLEFKLINIITGGMALFESCLVIFLAWFTDLAYWSFVIGMLANSVVTNVALLLFAGWYPKFIFTNNSFKYLFNFGLHGLVVSISNYLNQNIDYLLVGRILGTFQLGLYEFAYRVPNIIYQRIAQPVGMACFPAYSNVADDNEILFAGYIKATKYVCLVTFPMLIGMASLADIIVKVLWGEQWITIIVPFQILCFCSALRCICQSAPLLLYSKNRPDLPSKVSFVSLIWTFFSVAVLGYMFKITGVAVGMLISVIPSYILVYFVLKYTGKTMKMFVVPLLPIFFATAICAMMAISLKELLFFKGYTITITLCLSVLIGAISYIVAVRTLSPRLFAEAISLLETVLGESVIIRFVRKITAL